MDYANGKIYMLEPTCEYDEGDVYYGSTASTLVKRLSGHKKKSNGCKSILLFEKYGKDNIKIVLIESYPCSSKDELKSVEAKYQRENKCVNKRIEGRTDKEYREDHREKISEYYKLNREKILKNRKDQYDSNRDKKIEYQTEYRNANREKINTRARELAQKKKATSAL